MSKKILILANNDEGLYKFRKELIHELLSQGNEIYILLPYGEKVSLLQSMGCKFIDTPMNRRGVSPLTDLKLLIRYMKIVNSLNPDLILTYTIKPNIYGGIVGRLLRVPYITNITGLGTAVEGKGILKKIPLLLYRLALKKAHCVFFQNKENMQFFVDKKVVPKVYKLIPGSGVNLEHFNIIDYPKSDEKVVFLFVARIMKEKGIDQYLDAAKFIKKRYPNTEFHILGNCEEDYVNKLKEMHDKNIITYHGRQDDVRKFYKLSHCTIHPTYYPEGMSNVLLESAASGRPIITTNRSGCRELVDDGINGYIIEQKNSKDLINKIELFLKLSNKEKKAMGLAGRAKVEKAFDRQLVVDSYLKVINLLG